MTDDPHGFGPTENELSAASSLMEAAAGDLRIAGVPVIVLDTVDSTNAEAMRRARLGEPVPVWLRAVRQTAGRGRSGRAWLSPAGNLHASLLLAPDCPITALHQLSLVAGVATVDALRAVAPEFTVRLKWPNDALAGTAKLAGILVESFSGERDRPLHAVIGIGIDLVHAPSVTDRSVTSLKAEGYEVDAETMHAALAGALTRWLGLWDRGRGFASVRTAWLERAGPIGEIIAINTDGGRKVGSYRGLDHDGALLLADGGRLLRYTWGDVTLEASGPPIAPIHEPPVAIGDDDQRGDRA